MAVNPSSKPPTVGLLHPGAMGVTVGTTCGAPVIWCSANRSVATRERATTAGFEETTSLDEFCARADVIVAVCPPADATQVADDVANRGFGGVYVDANVVAPATTRDIAQRFTRFVDGSIVGPPATDAGTTRLFLSGALALDIASLWQGSKLEPIVVGDQPGAASALKMAYATWTKVSHTLLLDACPLAAAEGVSEALYDEWERSQPRTAARAERAASAVAPKAWRFVGEMEEIARTFVDADLPDGFAKGAEEVYRRIANGDGVAADLAAVLRRLND